MGFFANLKNAVAGKSGRRWYWPWVSWHGTGSSVKVTPESAVQVAAVYACVKVLAETVAQLPLKIYRRLPAGGKEESPEYPIYNILHLSPNEFQTSTEWREMLQGHLALRGNAYCEILYNNDLTVAELIPLHPDRVRIEKLKDRNELVYKYRRDDQKEIELSSDQVWHLKGMSFDGFMGISPITYAAKSIGIAIAADQYGASFYANGANPGNILTHPGNLSKEAAQRLKSSIDSEHGGPNKAGKTVVLEEGMTWQQLGVTQKDAQYIETLKYRELDACKIFRIPPHKIGILDRATFSNIEQQSIEFVTDSLLPWLVKWEQSINKYLIRDPEYFAEFSVDGLLRGEAKSRSEALEVQFRNGVINIDEWRSIENRNPLPNDYGKKHYVNMQVRPVDEPVDDDEQSNRIVGDTEPADNELEGFDYIPVIDDVSKRITSAELAEVKKIVGRKDEWNLLDKFYSKHTAYVEKTLEPLRQVCNAHGGALNVEAKDLTLEPKFQENQNFEEVLQANCETHKTNVKEILTESLNEAIPKSNKSNSE